MLRDHLRHWSVNVESATPGVRQSGALPYSVVDGRVVFMLITSRRNGRWLFPKGDLEPGLTAWESAALEAQEEAGVTGEIWHTPIGCYRASASADGSTLVDVDIFPLRVDAQLDEWKEMDQRLRHWAVLSEAKRLLNDRHLSRLAAKLQAQLSSKKTTA
jgi:8-oxo-dGTP pyrophosphatase MutT (NUDIX family)